MQRAETAKIKVYADKEQFLIGAGQFWALCTYRYAMNNSKIESPC
jgi:hypothetical protein